MTTSTIDTAEQLTILASQLVKMYDTPTTNASQGPRESVGRRLRRKVRATATS